MPLSVCGLKLQNCGAQDELTYIKLGAMPGANLSFFFLGVGLRVLKMLINLIICEGI